MEIDDNDAHDQNFHIVGEGSFKVSSVSHSYPLPKFEFDDLVENEGFFDITSQTDNHWIEEYSTALKSTRKNVWHEATSSESVEMLLKSVGQEEKVLEESNRHDSLSNVMDPKGELAPVVLGDGTMDKIGDDVNEESSKIATDVNELQESSVSKVECENVGSSQNVENASDNDSVNISNINENRNDDILNKDETAGITDMNVVRVIPMAQRQSNMNVSTDAVVTVESSKMLSPNTADAAASDVVTEDQPRSPILGVSSQNQAPEVEKDTVSVDAEKVAHLKAGREQRGETNSESLLDPKESTTGKDAEELPNLEVNMRDQQPASADVADPSGSDVSHPSLDTPQTSPLPDTKSIELSQSEKGKHDVTTGSMQENPTLSGSSTREEKSFTFEVNTGKSQNLSFSKSAGPSTTEEGAQGNSESKPRKRSAGKETAKKSNNLKEKTPTRRSAKVGKPPPLLTPSATGNVTPVSNPKPGGTTPVSTSNLPILNNATSVFPQSFTDNQQVQLRAQILVYGSLLSGMPPEEPHMIAAFAQSGVTDGERRVWEAAWRSYIERIRANKAQPNNLGSSTPNQGVNVRSAQSKNVAGTSSPIVNPVIPISSPLWNVPTPGDGSQSNAVPKSDLFSPHRTPGVHNFGGHNLTRPPQGPFPGQWVASSPVASFNARFSALPITESVKLTTVKESGAPTIPVIPVLSPGQSQTSRKTKKVDGNLMTSAALPTVSLGSTHGQPSRVDQNIEKVPLQEDIVSKIQESKVQAEDAAAHAAPAVGHYENVWSQLQSQKNSGLVSDDEAKLASLAVSIAAASSIAKVAASAAKIASDVAVQARLMADEVFLSNRTESHNQSGTTSIISAAKEAARRRIEAASAASKHAEILDAIVKAAEFAAEAVSQAGKVVTVGNPLSLKELVEAGPEGFWKHPPSTSQQGHSDKPNDEMALDDKVNSVDLTKNPITVATNERDKSIASGSDDPTLSKTFAAVSRSEFGPVNTSDVDQHMPQSTSNTLKDNTIEEGCLVEIRKDDDKKKDAWFAANVLTVKDGKAFVCYTKLESDDGSGKLKEWVPLEVEGTEPPKIRIAHPMTIMRSEGTRKRGRTALTDYDWSSGDRLDVWVDDCWCEAVVVEINKIDLTSLTVQFPARGETSVVRSWHVRPTLIWKDGNWIEWFSLKRSRSSEGDTPHEKRHKKLSDYANLVEPGRHEESKNISLPSSKGSSLALGKTGRNENNTTTKSGLAKKESRVVFGVPKPGKKQKFMDMSTHSVDDRNNTSNPQNDSVKLSNYLVPQPSRPRESKNKEKQAADVNPRVNKSRKPPVPSFRTLNQKDKSKPSKPVSHDAVTSDEIMSGDANNADEDMKETSMSKAVRKTASSDRKETKVAVEEKSSTSETEPRRSTRRIQPTSRLLEGLQTSLTTISNASPRSHKVTSKGSTNSS